MQELLLNDVFQVNQKNELGFIHTGIIDTKKNIYKRVCKPPLNILLLRSSE